MKTTHDLTARARAIKIPSEDLTLTAIVIAYDLGEENKLIGGYGRMLGYDIILAIAKMFEDKYKGVEWGETEEHGDWEETVHLFTRDTIKEYNIDVKIITA